GRAVAIAVHREAADGGGDTDARRRRDVGAFDRPQRPSHERELRNGERTEAHAARRHAVLSDPLAHAGREAPARRAGSELSVQPRTTPTTSTTASVGARRSPRSPGSWSFGRRRVVGWTRATTSSRAPARVTSTRSHTAVRSTGRSAATRSTPSSERSCLSGRRICRRQARSPRPSGTRSSSCGWSWRRPSRTAASRRIRATTCGCRASEAPTEGRRASWMTPTSSALPIRFRPSWRRRRGHTTSWSTSRRGPGFGRLSLRDSRSATLNCRRSRSTERRTKAGDAPGRANGDGDRQGALVRHPEGQRLAPSRPDSARDRRNTAGLPRSPPSWRRAGRTARPRVDPCRGEAGREASDRRRRQADRAEGRGSVGRAMGRGGRGPVGVGLVGPLAAPVVLQCRLPSGGAPGERLDLGV
ncbi:LOW QUALITY PROTEIN: phage integrase, partial [Rhodococcus opacus PD630]